MKVFVISVVLVGALSAIVFLGVLEGSIPDYDRLSDFVASGYTGGEGQGNVKIVGKIASIESLMPLEFTIHDIENPTVSVRVQTDEAPPQNFKAGNDVGLRGSRYDPETRTFHAYHITTKCPTKYEASEQAGAQQGYDRAFSDPLERALSVPTEVSPAALE